MKTFNNILGIFTTLFLGAQIASAGNPFMKFNVESKGEVVVLEWEFDKSYKADYFEIEKSLDGQKWFEVSMITPDYEDLNADQKYIDSNVFEGVQYYRIEVVTEKGEKISSDVSSFCKNKTVYRRPEVFLNDNNNTFVLKYTFENPTIATFNLVNSDGRILDIEPVNRNGFFTFDSSQLYADVYFLQIIEGEKVTRVKMTKK